MPSPPVSPDVQAAVPESQRLDELLKVAEPLVVADAERAEVLLREAHALAVELGDDERGALSLTLLGGSFYFRAQYQTALDILEQAQVAADRAQSERIAARIGNTRGICAVALGNYGEAMEYYQTSLEISRAHGDDAGRARVLSNMGLIHAELGDYQLALEGFQEVLRLAQRSGLTLSHSSATINTVRLYYHLGRLEEALALATNHLPLVKELGIRQHEVVLRVWMIPCLIETGHPAEAAREAEAVLELALDVNDREHVVYVRLFYGQALMELGQLDLAHEQLGLALEVARQHDIKPPQRTVLSQLSKLHAARGQWQQAYEILQAHQVLERTLHAEAVERRAKVLGVQMRLEVLQREAELERRRSSELARANTALQEVQDALAYRATHDALTGLANRAHFQAEVERTLQTSGDAPFGILFIDLDRFKQVNDTLGHDVGDELLREVARRLGQTVRSGDLVARMGGDEFTVVLRSLRSVQDAQRVAHKILNRLAQPIHVRGHTLHVTGSIGVAVSPQDGADVTTLQKHADIAMYRAKTDGKNGVRTFQATMGQEAHERVDVERDLRGALAEGEFVLHYQGQFDVQTRALRGFEALVRWQHPTQGLLPPSKFIGVAEDSLLIVPLGEWVLHEACRQAATWNAGSRELTMSVNVSALQFESPGFITAVQKALEDSGLPPQCLILELTESAVLRNPDAAAAQFARLRALGVRVALDDFGTGQSSLSLLRSLPIDFLKIDRSFMQDETAPDPQASRFLIGVMVTLAHGLNMHVTAEGVETPEQLELLGALGCDSLQGFLLARPLPPEEAGAYLGTA